MEEKTAIIADPKTGQVAEIKREPIRNSIAEWAVTILLLLFGRYPADLCEAGYWRAGRPPKDDKSGDLSQWSAIERALRLP
jgi:hypothetical protein